MDIRRLKPEAEITCEVETEKGVDPITFTFKMGFIALDEIPNYVYDYTVPRIPAGPKKRIPGREAKKEQVAEEPKSPVKEFRVSDIIRKAVTNAIHAWDLTDENGPIPCTPENKAKHLPLIFGFQVKRPKPVAIEAEPGPDGEEEDEEGPEPKLVDSVLVNVLADFAGRSENFIKN